MKYIKRAVSVLLVLVICSSFAISALAATAPTKMWVEPTENNGIPAKIDLFKANTGTTWRPVYVYQLYLPGNVDPDNCFLSWDGDMEATFEGETYASGVCPLPPLNTQETYTFKNGTQTAATFDVIVYKGSPNVQRVFIEIDESNGNPTIAEMDGDDDHEVTCKGNININGTWYEMPKIKGRGNATWDFAIDKKPYNITLKSKINFPGIESEQTKKWSFLAEVTDHSLLSNRSGYLLAEEMGIGQSTTSADVWMNGEYQGCYTVTPKTDSFVTKDGFMIEQDNYLEKSVELGGDPQFQLDYLLEDSGWSSCYNRITVKKMGDNLLGKDETGAVNERPENLEAIANNTIKPWLQDAWDAIRSDTGYNDAGKYYTDYIDIESFAKMYLLHEYAKSYDVCAGSILFHRDGMTDDYKLIAGPAWDLDNAMGSTCTNDKLGQGSDRRSGEGSFISIITEYKTSIYKTISKHADFMAEVSRQYNLNRSAFDGLPALVEQMTNEIAESATMNHYKVTDITGNQYMNTHKYSRAQNLGSGQYAQSYLATTNSKTDWPNYAANLKTYITTRSLWFHNTYYDQNFVDPSTCEHAFTDSVVEATCTSEGSITHTCTICGYSYTDTIPKIAHDYHDGVCSVCGEELITVTIACDEGVSVTVYETQNIGGAFTANATSANPRDSVTGMIDCSGDGQVNFVVNLAPEYTLTSVTAEPAGSYKNLKGPADTGIENGYRMTKVSGDATITVHAVLCEHNFETTVTEPTCTSEGFTTHTCTECGYSYTDNVTPKLQHDYEDGVCTVCGEHLLTVTIFCSEGASVTVYETQDINGASVANATSAYPRDSVTGMIDCSGDGQVNFVVNLEPGYTLAGVTAEPAGVYKNLKGPADTGITNGYRLTKITGDIALTVSAVICEHSFETIVTEPTCKSEGFTTYTCTQCGYSYTDNVTPKIPHDYQEGFCTVCGEHLLNVTISCDEGVSVTVYETQDIGGASMANATSANPRDSATGLIDCSGNGQVNFVVNLDPGRELESVTAAPSNAYKNLKGPEETEIENGYRLTKVKGDLTITVKVCKYITFDPNGGTGTMNAQKISSDAHTVLNENTFVRTGYTFSGWNTDPNGNGTSYADKTSVLLGADTVLYAQWTADGYTVTIENHTAASAVRVEGIENSENYLGPTAFKVFSDQACVVAYSTDGGQTYTKLTPAPAEEGESGYKNFTINVTGEMTLFIAPLGDVTLNGVVDRKDDNYIAKYINHWDGYELDAKQFLVADIDSDGLVNRKDDNKLAKHINHWDDVKEIFEW